MVTCWPLSTGIWTSRTTTRASNLRAGRAGQGEQWEHSPGGGRRRRGPPSLQRRPGWPPRWAGLAHLDTRGTGKSGWQTTDPAPTAVTSTPASVTSAESPARARLAALPSTSSDLGAGESRAGVRGMAVEGAGGAGATGDAHAAPQPNLPGRARQAASPKRSLDSGGLVGRHQQHAAAHAQRAALQLATHRHAGLAAAGRGGAQGWR